MVVGDFEVFRWGAVAVGEGGASIAGVSPGAGVITCACACVGIARLGLNGGTVACEGMAAEGWRSGT